MDFEKNSKNGVTTMTISVGESIEKALKKFCHHLKNNLIPDNIGVNWDFLRLEVLADSGRLIAYPASTSSKYRIEKMTYQIVSADLLSQYNQLCDEHDDYTFTTALNELEWTWINLFLDECRCEGLIGHRIQVWKADEENAMWEDVLK